MKRETNVLSRFTWSLHLLLVLAVFCVFFSSSVMASPKLSKKKMTLYTGSAYTIKLKNNKSKVKWKSSNKTIVSIYYKDKTQAIIYAKKKGTADIIARIGKKQYKCKVTVRKEKNFPEKKTILVGSKFTLKQNKKAKWSVSDSKIVKISSKSGKKTTVKAKASGKCKVTAKIGKKKYICTVTVIAKPGRDSREAVLPEDEYDVDEGTVFSGENVEKAKKELIKYTYKITPLVAPLNQYFYVETDNPDPDAFRFLDKSAKYKSPYTADASIGMTQERFIDVKYENRTTGRVKGGYIFKSDYDLTDGGELLLQAKITGTAFDGVYYPDTRYYDTEIKLSCPALKDYIDYLIEASGALSKSSFFEKLDAVQEWLDNNAIYPRNLYDSAKRSASTPYPFYATSPFPEIHVNKHYEMFERADDTLLTFSLYPYILHSTSFPAAVRDTAVRLDPSSTVSWGDVHYNVNITNGGTTKTYGGAGEGGYSPLYTNRIQKIYAFDRSAPDKAFSITPQFLKSTLVSFGEIAANDVKTYSDMLTGSSFKEKIGTGKWVRVLFERTAGKEYAYFAIGDTEFPLEDRLIECVESVWIDGRHINQYNNWEKGAVFSQYPTDPIIIRNVTYTDCEGKRKTEDLYYSYEDNGTWSAAYNYNSDPFYKGEIPEMFILTLDEVRGMGIDSNTNKEPEHGIIADGSAVPGTPF